MSTYAAVKIWVAFSEVSSAIVMSLLKHFLSLPAAWQAASAIIGAE